MDLLFKRYASPFPLLDGFIQTGRFCEFILEVSDLQKDDVQWEFYLHKIWDKTYKEFTEGLKVEQDNKEMSKEAIETTVKDSLSILASFNPIKEGG